MDQYGTVMIARLAAAPEDVEASIRSWADGAPGPRIPARGHDDLR